MYKYCPECGKQNCQDHNGNGIKSEVLTQKEIGKFIHRELKEDIEKLEKNVSTLQVHIDSKVKFVVMVSLAVFGVIGSVTVLDEVRLSSDIESLEQSVTELTRQVTEVKVIYEATLKDRIGINDLVDLERRLMQEISQLRSEVESLK